MEDKYILLSLEDDKAKKVAGILGNKTCKKIIDLLSEKEASEKDLSDELKIPLNTIEYNLKKLLEVGLIRKTKNFFWSKKGKKIPMYKISNKSIVISPHSKDISKKLKSILPVALLTGASTFAVYVYEKIQRVSLFVSQDIASKAPELEEGFLTTEADLAREVTNNFFSAPNPIWIWFLGGVLLTLIIFSIINWRKL